MKAKNLSWIFLLLTILIGLTSCSEDGTAAPVNEEVHFAVSPSSMEFTAEGGTKGI